jgi:hypothetical protein
MSHRHYTTVGAPSTHDAQASAPRQARPEAHPSFDVLELARQAGMLVMLDGQIGRERYHSVTGSLASLEHFAEVLIARYGTHAA